MDGWINEWMNEWTCMTFIAACHAAAAAVALVMLNCDERKKECVDVAGVTEGRKTTNSTH